MVTSKAQKAQFEQKELCSSESTSSLFLFFKRKLTITAKLTTNNHKTLGDPEAPKHKNKESFHPKPIINCKVPHNKDKLRNVTSLPSPSPKV
jgi:hypothetical protein